MEWDEAAATWDDDPVVRLYSEAAFRSLVDALDERSATLSGLRVLDFGCGTGLLTAQMAEAADRVTGLDLSPAMIERLNAKSLPNVTALAGRLEDHALGPFDLITCSSVLAFVDDYPETVRSLSSLLAPGGWLVQWDWEVDPDAEEPFGLSRADIEGALTGAGLGAVEVRTGFEVPVEGAVMAPLMGLGQRSKPG